MKAVGSSTWPNAGSSGRMPGSAKLSASGSMLPARGALQWDRGRPAGAVAALRWAPDGAPPLSRYARIRQRANAAALVAGDQERRQAVQLRVLAGGARS